MKKGWGIDFRAGADHLMMLDPHSPQLEGFFDHPVDCLKVVKPLFFFLNRHSLFAWWRWSHCSAPGSRTTSPTGTRSSLFLNHISHTRKTFSSQKREFFKIISLPQKKTITRNSCHIIILWMFDFLDIDEVYFVSQQLFFQYLLEFSEFTWIIFSFSAL